MAKYELITVTHFEDNEEAADAAQQQAFVEDWAKLCVEHWHHSRVKMNITENGQTTSYEAEVNNGPTKPSQGQGDRPAHRWPWMRADILQPKYGQPVMVYYEDDDEQQLYFGTMKHADDLPQTFDTMTVGGNNGFEVMNAEGLKSVFYKPCFNRIWWRTVEKPIIDEIH